MLFEWSWITHKITLEESGVFRRPVLQGVRIFFTRNLTSSMSFFGFLGTFFFLRLTFPFFFAVFLYRSLLFRSFFFERVLALSGWSSSPSSSLRERTSLRAISLWPLLERGAIFLREALSLEVCSFLRERLVLREES